MCRQIPGTQDIRGREFLYVESAVNETFHQLANTVVLFCPNIAVPSSGGAGEEKVRFRLKDGTSLMGISYKGDIEGWRRRFLGFCEASGRKYGSVREGRLFLSDGSSPSLEDIQISFD